MDTTSLQETIAQQTKRIRELETENERLKSDYYTILKFTWNMNDILATQIRTIDNITGIKTDPMPETSK